MKKGELIIMTTATLEKSEIVEAHLPCPYCGSSDALTLYNDHVYCFSCNALASLRHYKEAAERAGIKTGSGTASKPSAERPMVKGYGYINLEERGLSEETCRAYDYGVAQSNGRLVHIAGYHAEDGRLVGQKIRTPDKKFYWLGTAASIFGLQTLNTNKKARCLIITEGEIDCLTVAQVYRDNPDIAVVSVAGGARSLSSCLTLNSKVVCRYDRIIIMMDSDKTGRDAVNAVSKLLIGRLYNAQISGFKDASEAHMAGADKAIIDAVSKAVLLSPAAVLSGGEIKKRMSEWTVPPALPVPWNIPLNKMLYGGFRPGEIILVTGGTGLGKSTLCRNIIMDFAVTHREKVGVLALEESVEETIIAMLSVFHKRDLIGEWNTLSALERESLYDSAHIDEYISIYDHYALDTSGSLMETLEMMAAGGCKWLLLDHITIALSEVACQAKNGLAEVEQFCNGLRKICLRYGIGLIVVVQLRKTSGQASHEDGNRVSIDDLKGTGALKNIANSIVAVERTTQDENSCVAGLRILKARLLGSQTGSAGFLRWHAESCSYVECDSEGNETEGIVFKPVSVEEKRRVKALKGCSKSPRTVVQESKKAEDADDTDWLSGDGFNDLMTGQEVY